MIFEEAKREIHNLIYDVQDLLYDWSKGASLFEGANLEYFIIEWDKLVCLGRAISLITLGLEGSSKLCHSLKPLFWIINKFYIFTVKKM